MPIQHLKHGKTSRRSLIIRTSHALGALALDRSKQLAEQLTKQFKAILSPARLVITAIPAELRAYAAEHGNPDCDSKNPAFGSFRDYLKKTRKTPKGEHIIPDGQAFQVKFECSDFSELASLISSYADLSGVDFPADIIAKLAQQDPTIYYDSDIRLPFLRLDTNTPHLQLDQLPEELKKRIGSLNVSRLLEHSQTNIQRSIAEAITHWSEQKAQQESQGWLKRLASAIMDSPDETLINRIQTDLDKLAADKRAEISAVHKTRGAKKIAQSEIDSGFYPALSTLTAAQSAEGKQELEDKRKALEQKGAFWLMVFAAKAATNPNMQTLTGLVPGIGGALSMAFAGVHKGTDMMEMMHLGKVMAVQTFGEKEAQQMMDSLHSWIPSQAQPLAAGVKKATDMMAEKLIETVAGKVGADNLIDLGKIMEVIEPSLGIQMTSKGIVSGLDSGSEWFPVMGSIISWPLKILSLPVRAAAEVATVSNLYQVASAIATERSKPDIQERVPVYDPRFEKELNEELFISKSKRGLCYMAFAALVILGTIGVVTLGAGAIAGTAGIAGVFSTISTAVWSLTTLSVTPLAVAGATLWTSLLTIPFFVACLECPARIAFKAIKDAAVNTFTKVKAHTVQPVLDAVNAGAGATHKSLAPVVARIHEHATRVYAQAEPVRSAITRIAQTSTRSADRIVRSGTGFVGSAVRHTTSAVHATLARGRRVPPKTGQKLQTSIQSTLSARVDQHHEASTSQDLRAK